MASTFFTGRGDIYCFVDCEIFVRSGFNFKSKQLDLLRFLVDQNHICLLMPDSTLDEILHRLDNSVVTACDQLNSAIRKSSILKLPQLAHNDLNIKEIDAEVTAQRVRSQFLLDLSSFNCVSVDTSKITAKQILKDYYSSTPPFSSNKKHEFKDAVAVHALKEWCLDKTQKVAVISADKALGRAFEHEDRFSVYESVSELASIFPDKDLATKIVHQLVEDTDNVIFSAVERWIHNQYFQCWDYDFVHRAVGLQRLELYNQPVVKSLTQSGSTVVAKAWWSGDAEVVCDGSVEVDHYYPDGAPLSRDVSGVRGTAEFDLSIEVTYDAKSEKLTGIDVYDIPDSPIVVSITTQDLLNDSDPYD